MKKAILLAGMAMLSLCRASPAQNNEPASTYKWALVTVEEKSIRSLETKSIQPGLLPKRVILYFQPYSNTYLYLLALGPEGQVELLFPGDFGLFSRDDYRYKSVFLELGELPVPGGEDCGELLLLASNRRLSDLEKNFRAYQAAGAEEKKALAATLSMRLGQLWATKNLEKPAITPPGKMTATFRSADELQTAIRNLGEERIFQNLDEVRILYGCETEN